MEKRNLKANNFDKDNEIKKIQEDYLQEIKNDSG